jgi:thiol-disulfide isomerase/thioredoxin
MQFVKNIAPVGILIIGVIAIVFYCPPFLPAASPTPAPIVAPAPKPASKPALPQLAAFTATWCGPCQRAKPIVDQIEKAGLADVVRVDIDKQPDTARQYQVSSVPTFILYRVGKEVLRTHDIGKVKRALHE